MPSPYWLPPRWWWCWRGGRCGLTPAQRGPAGSLPRFLFVAGALLFGVHLIPSGAFEDYQVVSVPFWALWVGWAWSRMGPVGRIRRRWLLALVLGNVLVGRGQVWLDLSGGQRPLVELEAVARVVREVVSTDGRVFTPHVAVAVQAGRSVPPGQEMGVFSYQPALSPQDARRLRLLDDAAVMEHLRDPQVQAVVLTSSDFLYDGAHRPLDPAAQRAFRASLHRLIDAEFKLVFRAERWGQYQEQVQVFVRRVSGGST